MQIFGHINILQHEIYISHLDKYLLHVQFLSHTKDCVSISALYLKWNEIITLKNLRPNVAFVLVIFWHKNIFLKLISQPEL